MGRAGGHRLVRMVSAVTAAVFGAIACTALLPVAAEAATCASPGDNVAQVPWAQQLIDPDQVWPFSTGAGVTVAVVDTGVDGNQPQLNGHVDTGTNVAASGAGNTDCAGHGTQVAGLIAAQVASGIGFRGLAPDASILPIKVVSDGDGGGSTDGTADPGLLAKGIDAAVSRHADIILVSLVSYQDSGRLSAAVRAAQNAGALVIAAAGDQGGNGNPTPYPAAYAGVLGVGAIGQDTSRTGDSQYGPYVDLVAPGDNVVTTQTGHGLALVKGTALAAGYVAGAAALAHQRWPNTNAADLAARLEATATPAAENSTNSPRYGHGIVNPYQAVTERLAPGAPARVAGLPPAKDRVDLARQRAWTHSTRLALLLAAIGIAVVLAVVALALLAPRGRRRHWRSGLATPPHDDLAEDLPSPPVQLFKDA